MSDLDLDAIEVYRAADDPAGARQRAVLARKLANEIGPITAERFARDLEELADALERLRANQLPDGGFWDVEYFEPTGMGFVEATGEPTYQRRVWYGPVEPIPAESDSAGLDTPDPDTTQQTTPNAV